MLRKIVRIKLLGEPCLKTSAIISRELKKPCVIGTEIATEVFKDGDLVEVDAEKGIVRKIYLL